MAGAKGGSPLRDFIRSVDRDFISGKATEHTYRPALKALLQSLGKSITATNEPKRVECGAPDFVVVRRQNGLDFILGHVEAKDVGVSLESIERDALRSKPRTRDGGQLRRYLAALPNLVLTNNIEFRWYVDGSRRGLAQLATIAKKHVTLSDETATGELITSFLRHEPQPISKPRELAERLARLTHLIRDVIVEAFKQDRATENMRNWRDAFEEVLVPDLKVPDFADMFAQTLTYGLFAARCRHAGPEPFQRLQAAAEIPKTNPFLRALFDMVTGVSLDEEPFSGLVDDVTQTLALADIDAVLRDFGKRKAKEDPVIHFYETFLAAYDPALREKRGVYYTPEPVVSFIVRSVDRILKDRFGCANGLADTERTTITKTDAKGKQIEEKVPRVLILDPACGTGTFLYTVIDSIRAQFMAMQRAGQWSSYVHAHLLPRIFGFELLMAPYAVAHFKLGMQLAGQDLDESIRARWAYDFESAERLGVYLTNTLEEAERRSRMLFANFIAEEANAAAEIKADLPIMVVMGNPPYAGHSANKGMWIRGLLEDYKRDCPELAKPAQAKWLQDDYVKFLRFGQWRIEQTGQGILAFITNHSYLSNLTFRGMRRELLKSFDEIYLLDLHGNSTIGEKCPDGSPDVNVFDIQQGVAIAFFIKHATPSEKRSVGHFELWGSREGKYGWLEEADISTCPWVPLAPQAPSYLFHPQDQALASEYEKGVRLPDLFNQAGDPAPGIVTTHDDFAISWSPAEAVEKVERLLGTGSEDEARRQFTLCTQSQWNYGRAKRELADRAWREQITSIRYRPFDSRWTVYNSNVAVHRRERVSRHMLAGPNLALGVCRQIVSPAWTHVLVSDGITDDSYVSNKSRERSYVLPLYVYGGGNGPQLEIEATKTRRPNLDPKVVGEIAKQLGLTFVTDGSGDLQATLGPDDVFRYIYAALHSGGYRQRYKQYLRRDFPRVQFTSDRDLFRALCQKGAELLELHLLTAASVLRCENPLQSPLAFPEPGDNLVEPGHPKYLEPGATDPISGKPLASGRVYISRPNKRRGEPGQYFHGVAPETWDALIGGYQPCEKWLKDRRERRLSAEEIVHYQKVVVVMTETLRVVGEIDDLIPGWPLA